MSIDAQGLLIVIIVGVVTGWVGAFSDRGSATGDLVAGIIGAYLGIYISNTMNVHIPVGDPLMAQAVTAIVGASIVLAISRFFFSRA